MHALLTIFITTILCIVSSTQEKIRYDNFQVHRIKPKNQENLNFLTQLEKNSTLNFWTGVRTLNDHVDVMVPPHNTEEFLKLMEINNLEPQIFIPNVQDVIDKERGKRRVPNEFEWRDYHTLEEINTWLSNLAKQYPNQVTIQKGGISYEGRPIVGVRVSFAPGNKKKSVFIEGTIHACEWISSAVTTYILNQLLTSTDPNIREVAESHDWYVFPVTNPDGFVYTHSKDRTWRKTRVPYSYDTTCYGADPNRNWAYHYKEGGTSDDPCSTAYAGPTAFSEPSIKSLSKYLQTVGPNLEAYFSFHSYAQILLIPYGYSEKHLDNYDELYDVGLKGIYALSRRYGTKYDIGNVAEIIYTASGGSLDWVKGTFGTRITYTFELPDTGNYGFLLPASQIIPTGEETLDSVVTILQEFAKRPRRIG